MALSTKEVADELGTDSKTLRKFLRSHLPKDSLPGQGGRYAFEKKDIGGLKKAWVKWSADKVDKDEPADADVKTKKPRASKSKAKAEPVVEDEGDDEPTDAAIAELDEDDVEDLEDLLADDES